MPAERSISSLAAISSGVPNRALSPAASRVWSNDSRLAVLFCPPGEASALTRRCWLANRVSMALAFSSAFLATKKARLTPTSIGSKRRPIFSTSSL